MSNDSSQDRERLKEEYKRHYRKIRETKRRLAHTNRKKNIADALKNMDTSAVTETFDEFLYKVKSKIADVEARLDVAMESLSMGEDEAIAEEERDRKLKREKAKETLKQAKMEMGLLYSEIERQADSLEIKKTIGNEEIADEDTQVEETGPNDEKLKTGPEE